MAASATFALKAGEWFRRGRLFMVSPVHGDYRRCQAEIPLIVLSRFPEPALYPSIPTPDVMGFAKGDWASIALLRCRRRFSSNRRREALDAGARAAHGEPD